MPSLLYILRFVLKEQGLQTPFITLGLSEGQDVTQIPLSRLDLSVGQFSVVLRHFLSSLLPEAQDATYLPFSRYGLSLEHFADGLLSRKYIVISILNK
jgi:hypothetical protein